MYTQIRDIDQTIERNEVDYASIDAKLQESDERISEIKDRREKTLEQFRVLELEQTQRRIEREHVTSQLEDRYQTPFAELRAQLVPVAEAVPAEPAPDLEAMEAELARYRTKIARIGDVNLGAIKEYQQLKERHEFLSAQKEDLEKAIEDLHKVIHKINTVSQERFMQTFQAINERLAEVFPRLFNGGTAELVLTDPDKPLETGVEYMIHPPGKKLTRMSLLSGGEKAMAAIAFIFAIFLIRPTSFCLLDEIDAPLDDANVYPLQRPAAAHRREIPDRHDHPQQAHHGVRRHPVRHHHGTEGRLEGGFRQPQAAGDRRGVKARVWGRMSEGAQAVGWFRRKDDAPAREPDRRGPGRNAAAPQGFRPPAGAAVQDTPQPVRRPGTGAHRQRKIDAGVLDQIEELLITSDIGVQTATALIERISAAGAATAEELQSVLREEILAILTRHPPGRARPGRPPHVILVVGVNGVGKTTTIGKLAARLAADGQKVS